VSTVEVSCFVNRDAGVGATISADELVDDVVHELGTTEPSSTVY
jgi:hypothetical protein